MKTNSVMLLRLPLISLRRKNESLKILGTLLLLVLALCALPRLSLAQTPPLVTSDMGGVSEPLEHQYYNDINLLTGSLFGLSFNLDTIELQYDESYGPQNTTYLGNLAANFDIKTLTFRSGQEVGLPVVRGSQLKDGVFRYQFGSWFSQAGTTDTARTLLASGRFVQIEPSVAFRPRELHDATLGVVYTLAPLSGDPSTLVPVQARFDEGHTAVYTWQADLSTGWRVLPQSVKLLKNSVELERFDFVWETVDQPRLKEVRNYLNGQAALWRSVFFRYRTSPFSPGQVLESAFAGVGESGPYPSVEPTGVRWGYQDAGQKEVISSVFNYRDIELRRFTLGQAGVGPGGAMRSVYTGAAYGDGAQAPTTFAYQDGSWGTSPTIRVTSPLEPNDPVSYQVHQSRGVLLMRTRQSCPSPEYQATYYEGGNFDRLLRTETFRERCDSPVTRRYDYLQNGTLAQIAVEAPTAGGGVDRRVANLQFQPLLSSSGLRWNGLSSTVNQVGKEKRWEYDADGRVKRSANLAEGVDTHYSYTYYDTNRKHLSSARLVDSNGRIDVIQYSPAGLPVQSTLAFGTSQEELRSWGYDNYLRESTMVDSRNKVHVADYDASGRVQRATSTSSDGSQSIASSFSYNYLYPDLLDREEITYRSGSSEQVSYFQSNYLGNLPLESSLVAGGTNTSEVTLWQAQYDPSTLRLISTCEQYDGSQNACTYFSYYSQGQRAGLMAAMHNYGGLTLGGSRRIFRYNDQNEITGYQIADNAVSQEMSIGYDNVGRISQVGLNSGSAGVQEDNYFHYDGRDRIIRTSQKLDGVLVTDSAISFNNGGRSSKISLLTDSVVGASVALQYDPSTGRLLQKQIYDSSGLVTHAGIFDSYDLFDRPTALRQYIDGVGWLQYGMQYSRSGDLISEVDPHGVQTTFSYDSFGRLTGGISPLMQQTFQFGIENGFSYSRLTEQRRTNDPTLAAQRIAESQSDALDRPVLVSDEQRGTTTSFTYNSRSFLSQVTTSYPDASDSYLNFEYDGLGRMNTVYLNGSPWKTRSYSGLGYLLSSTDAAGALTSFSYDNLGRLLNTQYPDGTENRRTNLQFIFPPATDGTHQLLQGQDRGGALVTRKFARRGDLLSEVASGGVLGSSSKTLSYPNGRLASVLSTAPGRSARVVLGYDAFGRVSSESHTISTPAGKKAFSLSKTFNDLGELTAMRYPPIAGAQLGTYLQYGRDGYGRIENVLVNGTQLASYQYDGPVLTRSRLGDIDRAFSYDQLTGDATRIQDTVGASVLTNQAFTYDAEGRRRTLLDTGMRAGSGGAYAEQYEFSQVGQLDRTTLTGPILGTLNLNYSSSLDGRLGAAGEADANFRLPSFSYDLYGNTLASSSGDLALRWSRIGASGIDRPTSGLTGQLYQDGFGRFAWYRLSAPGFLQEVRHVRDRGMLLLQSEEGLSALADFQLER